MPNLSLMVRSFFLSLVSDEYGLVIRGLEALVAVLVSSSGVMKLLTVTWMMFPLMLLIMLAGSSYFSLYLVLVVLFRMDLITIYYDSSFLVSLTLSYIIFFLYYLKRLILLSLSCHDTFLIACFPGL